MSREPLLSKRRSSLNRRISSSHSLHGRSVSYQQPAADAVPEVPGPEPHSNGSNYVSDAMLGFSDGICVPFALMASLSSLGSSRLVIIGGLAELISGFISMGVSGYLAAKNDYDHYQQEKKKEEDEVENIPNTESDECVDILRYYGVSLEICQRFVHDMKKDKHKWVEFMMKFELGLGDPPSAADAWKSGAIVGGSYFVGGLIPLMPYFFLDAFSGLCVSVGVTVVMLFVFGFLKTYIGTKNMWECAKGGAQILFVGSLAAASSYLIVWLIEGDESLVGV